VTRILVVEDEESFSDPLSYLLRREGYEVAVADDGPAALDEFDRNGADLVLLDLMLPGLPGTEVCRQLRARSNVPVIMLTAKDSEIDKVVGLELGADDYVTKPFSFRELLARIRALLRRSEAQAEVTEQETVELGQVKVDLAGRRLLRGGEVLPIKPKAFDLLLFLIRNAGHVFTRDQLLERVWGYDYAGETRTVDVHVHWLRAQIEADPANPVLLETVRGVGYVLRRPEAD
jgi:two-component system response regulator RegX3